MSGSCTPPLKESTTSPDGGGFDRIILFETKRHLLQIQGKNVFLPDKTFWITEAPSMIVKNRFFFRVFVIVFIVVDLGKNECQRVGTKMTAYIWKLTSMSPRAGSQYPAWPALAPGTHVAHQPGLRDCRWTRTFQNSALTLI